MSSENSPKLFQFLEQASKGHLLYRNQNFVAGNTGSLTKLNSAPSIYIKFCLYSLNTLTSDPLIEFVIT